MPITINPIFPVIAAQGTAPDLPLQPGTTIDAKVLKILTNDLVRIAIANLAIEVFSEVPLQAGQSLQLAVSQTAEGIRLAVVGQGPMRADEGPPPSAGENQISPDVMSLRSPVLPPEIGVSGAVKPPADATPAKDPLTPLQALAVSAAAQSAAARQGSLAPLFANLEAALGSARLPPKLQQAAVQLLALRSGLDPTISGSDLKGAFEKSGLFLESSFASGSARPSPSSGVPDLKAALLVLRQILQSFQSTAAPETPAARAANAVPHFRPSEAAPESAVSTPELHSAAAPPLALNPVVDIEVEEIFLPHALLPVADDFAESGETIESAAAAPTPESGNPTRVQLKQPSVSLRPGMPEDFPQKSALPVRDHVPREPVEISPARAKPPPFRGALPSAQPAVPASLERPAALSSIVHHLLADTDAAIARQTLLQVASLPDRAELAGSPSEAALSRWNFEIPFATPAGTAIAQFEISRDSARPDIEPLERVWRARFALDVEPAGPVHALISLSGNKTSVRMWAERASTATQLRGAALQLSQALSSADLQPGDIVIRDGVPPQSKPAPAGHFLNRAS